MIPNNPQWQQALTIGNNVRTVRAELRRELKALPFAESRRRLGKLLTNRDPRIQTAVIDKVLTYAHGTGPQMAREVLLVRAKVTPGRRVGDLTDRQITAIVEALEPRWGVVRDVAA